MLNAATDMPQLLVIEKATQISPWSQETFQRCIDAGSESWVLEVQDNLCGFIFVLSNAGEGHILNICIHPTYQHQGYGCQLLTEALTHLKKRGVGIAYLEVRKGNAVAIALYKKLGFTQIGERKNYYIKGTEKEDALVFAKNLSRE
jgi:ribosomal-protein-alanine N-acetyltransferase